MIQFILTARTVLYDTRIREANEILKVGEGESKVIDLNKLNEKELNVMSNILRNNGLWGNLSNLSRSEKKKRLKDRKWGNSEFQSILVDVVNSTDMKNKIETIVSGIKSVSVSYYEVLILALLVKIMSLNIDAQDIGKIIGVNAAFDPRFTQDENVQEILDFSKEATDFRIKSAVPNAVESKFVVESAVQCFGRMGHLEDSEWRAGVDNRGHRERHYDGAVHRCAYVDIRRKDRKRLEKDTVA